MIETWDDLCKKALKLPNVYEFFGGNNKIDLCICNLHFSSNHVIRAKCAARYLGANIFIADNVSYDNMLKIMKSLNKEGEKK